MEMVLIIYYSRFPMWYVVATHHRLNIEREYLLNYLLYVNEQSARAKSNQVVWLKPMGVALRNLEPQKSFNLLF